MIIALVHPVVAALVLTGVAAWYLQDFRISDMALVQKVVRLTPPGIKAMIMGRTARSVPAVPVKLALPPPDAVRAVLSRRNMMSESSKNGTMRYKIASGGQTGVDRAALDVAIELGFEYGGWCPKEGWAEDLVSPPSTLVLSKAAADAA